MEFDEITERFNKAKLKRDTSQELLNTRLQRKDEIMQEIETVLKSQSVLQEVAKEVQSQLSLKIESIVNLALQCCFPDYTFKLQYVSARGKTEVNFVVLLNGEPVSILDQNGGGLVDVMTFALRVAVFNISRTNNVIVFDEAFKFLSKGLRDKIGDLIHTLSEELNLQFIEVTHIEEFMEHSDRKFVIKKSGGISHVAE